MNRHRIQGHLKIKIEGLRYRKKIMQMSIKIEPATHRNLHLLQISNREDNNNVQQRKNFRIHQKCNNYNNKAVKKIHIEKLKELKTMETQLTKCIKDILNRED